MASEKQQGQLSPGRRNMAAACFVVSDALLLGNVFRVSLLSMLWYLPYVLLILGLVLLFARDHTEVYDKKRAVVLFVIAGISYFSVRLLSMAGTFPGETLAAVASVSPLITHTALGFGCLVLFFPGEKVVKWSYFFLAAPTVAFAVYICMNPAVAALLGICVLVAYGVLRYKLMPKKQKDMIKGAVLGSFIAGDGGAIVGAMVAKEKHEAGAAPGPGSGSAAKDMIKGAAIGSVIAGDAGAVVGAMVGKEKHNGKKS